MNESLLEKREQEMQVLKPEKESVTVEQNVQIEGDHSQQKQTIRFHFSKISRLSVNNLNTALLFIRENWKSGFTQCLVNIPFALNSGFNSGADPSVGLTTAFIAAFVNGFFSGSNHSIYGPSFVAHGANYLLAQQYGFEIVPWFTIIVGLMIFLVSWFKWHHLIDFMPTYVIEGFSLGLGFKILNGFMGYSFGLFDTQGNRGVSVFTSRITMYQEYFERGDMDYFFLAMILMLALIILTRINANFPWFIVSTAIGMGIGIFYQTDRCLRSLYGNAGLKLFSFIQAGGPKFSPSLEVICELVLMAIPVVFYILIQNLMCSKGAESLTGVRCDNDQEMTCVSIANLVSGIFGGLSCCASMRLFVLNMKVRSTNKWASIINAFSLVTFYGLFHEWILDIPLYVIGGHLMYISYTCGNWPYIYMLYRTGRRLVLFKLFLIVFLCVYYGPLESIVIGSLYAMLQFAERMSAAASEIIVEQEEVTLFFIKYFGQNRKDSLEYKHSMIMNIRGDIEERGDIKINNEDDLPDERIKGSFALYRFNGSLNYINIKVFLVCFLFVFLKNHINQIKQLPETDYVILSFRYVSVFDDESIDKLSSLVQNLIRTGREILITGLHKGMIQEMKHNDFFNDFFLEHKDKYKLLGDQADQ